MKQFLAAAAILVPLALAANSAQAAPANPFVSHAPAASSSIVLADWDDRGWRRRCHFWRHECAERWPGLGWRFRRCLVIHGCGGW